MTLAWRVVTVAREYGSGGATIAAEVARRLGYKLLDRALIDQLASSAHVDASLARRLDERVDPWLYRISRSLWHGGPDAVALPDASPVVDSDRVAALARRLVEEAAALGRCVIVGRGAQCALRDRSDAFHVFVYAAAEERARRLGARLVPGADAATAMEAVDAERAAYVQRHYGADWSDRRLYHLLVNSGLGDGVAVDAILAAMGAESARSDAGR